MEGRKRLKQIERSWATLLGWARTILAASIAHQLTVGKKLTLAAVGLAVLSAPIVIGVLTAPTIHAQNAPANTPKFEVASIRACQDPSNGPAPHSSPGRLATDCHELLNLIGNAYNAFADGHLNFNAEPAPINGGPPWLQSASYDINAKAEGNPSVEMMLGPMMQRLLEDRFQLKIHRQTSEGPVYFLTVARGGPKLHPFTEGSCTPFSNPPPPLQPGTKYCGSTISGITSSLEALGATLDEFSKTLRTLVDRPVIDKTGITGRFDLRVKFSREGTDLAAIPAGERSPRAGTVRPVRDPDPSEIFTAIQEQLGLKLESGRGPVDTLVIDHIERPTEN
jgi:bla regulator protein BlaR1